jgi:uroporphyrinogen decarboxylase
MEECGAFPNFVASSGCDIPHSAPWENIDAFFEAVRNYYGKAK